MRKRNLVLAFAVLMAMGTVGLLAAGGPWKVSVRQNGTETSELQAGLAAEVQGSGFHARVLPVKVCVDGRACQLADVDTGGDFVLLRTFSAPGTYTIDVYQARDMQIHEWRLRASQRVTVN